MSEQLFTAAATLLRPHSLWQPAGGRAARCVVENPIQFESRLSQRQTPSSKEFRAATSQQAACPAHYD
jgi:hypothetical protein